MSKLEDDLAFQIKALALPTPEREYRFVMDIVGPGPDFLKRVKRSGLKDWRFDFAWPDLMLAVEVEGITREGGRHQRIGGFKGDLDKYHTALMHGWIVYRTSGHLIKSGESVALIEKIIARIRHGRTATHRNPKR